MFKQKKSHNQTFTFLEVSIRQKRNDSSTCDLLLLFKLLMSFPQHLQLTFTFLKWDIKSDCKV